MTAKVVPVLMRRGTTAQWAEKNPVLMDGEEGFDTDLRIVKTGDGVTHWVDLGGISVDHAASPEEIQDAVDEYLEENPISTGLEWVQSTPSATWTIPHTLGRKPAVDIYVGGQKVLAPTEATSTQVVITFPSPQTGTATLS